MVPQDRTLLEEFLERLRAQAPLLARYREDPALFFTERGVRFFPEFERLFRDLYRLKTTKAAVLAPRGGGKTFGAGVLATAFFLFRDFDVGIVAGSETQALALFSYIAEWLGLRETEEAVEELRRSEIRGISGNRIVAKTASARSIRGMHLGRGRRGALLVIDEEAEAEEDVVRAARYTVRTAEPAVIVRTSTYHKLSGTFADLVENHDEMGYELYRWSSFDAARPCTYSCERCPVLEFRERYCQGKARTSKGWIDVSEIRGEWQDTNRETFEVEVMGMRPASAGLVITPEAIERAVVRTTESGESGKGADQLPKGVGKGKGVCYINNSLSEAQHGRAHTNNENDLWYADASQGSDPAPKGYGWFAIDWGFVQMTAVVILGIAGNIVNVLHTEAFERQGVEAIIQSLKELRERYGVREIYADSSHPFENSRLREEGFALWGPSPETLGVPFVSFKEEGVAILSWLFEKEKIRIPDTATVLLRQLRAWRRDRQGHIVKKDDHFPDALVAAMMKLKLMGVGVSKRKTITTTKPRLFASYL